MKIYEHALDDDLMKKALVQSGRTPFGPPQTDSYVLSHELCNVLYSKDTNIWPLI